MCRCMSMVKVGNIPMIPIITRHNIRDVVALVVEGILVAVAIHGLPISVGEVSISIGKVAVPIGSIGEDSRGSISRFLSRINLGNNHGRDMPGIEGVGVVVVEIRLHIVGLPVGLGNIKATITIVTSVNTNSKDS